MDGVQALKEIKSFLPNTHVIMLTAIGSALEAAKKCVQMGAFAYVIKPVDLNVLEDVMRSALHTKGGTTS